MLGILAFFNSGVSAKLRAFIISFSLIDDALALIILAAFYTNSLNLIALFLSIILLAILIIFNKFEVKNNFYYLGIGILLWITMVEAGIHGTLCGALLALVIPVKIGKELNSSFQTLENVLRNVVHYYILPFFIFINSGIKFNSFSLDILTSNISLGIILGLFLGKQLGILSFSYLAIKKKWSALPSNTTWTKFYAVSILGGVGFTLSLFIGDLTFEVGSPHYMMRSAVIIGSLLSAIFGTVLFAYSLKQKNSY